ncbi:MAG: phosphatase PAP2 family protein [Oscillospiraceae bacterium]
MKNFVKKYGVGIFVFIVLMIIGLFVDLPLTNALYHPQFMPSVLMECFGTLPLYLPFLLFFSLAASDNKIKSKLRIIATGFGLCASAAVVFVGVSGLIKRKYIPDMSVGYVAGAAVFIMCVTIMFLFRCKDNTKPKLYFLFGVGCVYSVLGTVIINILKLIWKRTRYDDMLALGNFDKFTSWLQPFGNGGTSFPSGHTAAASIIFVLIVGCSLFAKWQGKEKLVWTLCGLFVAFMAINRLIIGRHFFSDTVAAAFVSLVVLEIIINSKTYKLLLKRVNAL